MAYERVDSESSLENTPNASFASSCATLTKTMIGSGILAMPAVLASVGAINGLLLMALAAVLSGLGQYLLIIVATTISPVQTASIRSACKDINPYLSIVFDVAIIFKSLGVSISYFMVIGDSLVKLFPAILGDYALMRSIWITASLIVVIPLVLKKKMDSLKKTSIAGILVAVYFCIMALVVFIQSGRASDTALFKKSDVKTIANAFSVFIFAFTCHQNVFPVYNESIHPDPERMKLVITTGILTSAAIYTVFAVFSYYTFGDACNGNVLFNHKDSYLALIGRALITLLAAFTIPLQIHPFKNSVKDILKVFGAGELSEEYGNVVVVTATLTAYTVAVWLKDLVFVVSITGKVAGVIVCYILPSVLYMFSEDLEKSNLMLAVSFLMIKAAILVELVTFIID